MSTLLAGDTSWWSDELIVEAFGTGERVFVVGDERPRRERTIRRVNAGDPQRLERVLRLGFERVVYLSRQLAFAESADGEFQELSRLLEGMLRQGRARVLYVTTDALDLSRTGAGGIRDRALEELCSWYRDKGLDLTVLRVPYLSDPRREGDYWGRVLDAAREGRAWDFGFGAAQPCDFVATEDLARLVGEVFAGWGRARVLRLRAKGDHTFGEAAELVRASCPRASLAFSDAPVNPLRKSPDEVDVGELLGFECAHDVVEELPAAARDTERGGAERGRVGHRLARALRGGSPLVVALELVGGFLLVEWLNLVLQNSVQFRMIDLRLVYVVVFAATYGVRVGIAASFLMILSLVWAFARQGTLPLSLLSDGRTWLPFILYLIMASTVGYTRQKCDEDLRFAEHDKGRLQDQVEFLSGLYDEACESRNAYRRDLLQSRDGFGRIFDVVKRLSQEEPSKIFSASIGVLEDVLATDRAAIYVINDSKDGFARLVVSSKAISGRLPKSIRLDDYRSALDTLDSGEVWFNAGFEAGMPSYMAGVKSSGHLRVLIMVYDVPFEQASSYYMNLVHILSGLMENFLIRAWHVEEAREAERHVEGTSLLTREEFLKEVASMRQMRREHVSDYRILEVDRQGRGLQEVAGQIAGQMRSTDQAGVGRDGRVYLLLRQVDDKTLPIVMGRLERAGIQVRPCTDEAAL